MSSVRQACPLFSVLEVLLRTYGECSIVSVQRVRVVAGSGSALTVPILNMGQMGGIVDLCVKV